MRGYIYLIRNKINGKGYVGQTGQSILARWEKHKSLAMRGKGYAIGAAIKKYGCENFTITEIVMCEEYLLDALEKYFIVIFNTTISRDAGYNLREGGHRAAGWNHSEETKVKQRLVKLGLKHPVVALANKFRKHSEETRMKLSIAGKKSPGTKGTKASQETRLKMSLAHKNISEETRAKLRAAHARRKERKRHA